MKRKPKLNSYQSWAEARAVRRLAEGKRIVFGEDEDVELTPEQVNKLQRRADT